ncbi:prolipoprotein diacylglyceryl transferase [Tumidithrix elongata RA019]|uniref:Phosphatidylglycerol--prolipoprotein diacylglyceryl transferase n=2 Tax=Tumidithrix TaxID=3088355 RepID=A0AAW9Q0W4_9CYAN|nr:prolipoprotein diacylglyceryl transferase [Tumidithrix elongata RA019]
MHMLNTLPLAFEFTSPGPVLLNLGPLTIRWYGVLIASAVILGTLLAQKLAEKRGIDPNIMGDLVIWLVIGAIPGARIYYVLFAWSERFQYQPWYKVFAIWEGGIAIHGAIIGGVIAAIIFAKRNHLSVWKLADLVMPALILGQAIGRWGNFFNSEAFGTPTDLPWKLLIPPDRRPPGSFTEAYYHPTFLYESVWNLLVFSLLAVVFNRFPKAKPGTMVMVYLIAYSAGRLWIEGLRTDSLMLGPLRIAQVISLAAIAFGIFGLWWLYGAHREFWDTIRKPVQHSTPESTDS